MFYGNYQIVLKITKSDAKKGSHPGQCDKDVLELSKKPYIAKQLMNMDKDWLKKELSEYGAWEKEELEDHNENLQRILWIACGDINEENR